MQKQPKKDTRIFVRISTELKTQIDVKAKALNISKSKLIQEAIIKQIA